MLHVHVQSFRPDRIYRTGVIEPYPIQQWNPMDVAQRTLSPFIEVARPMGPAVSSGPEPEEVVASARAVADALRAGIRMPRGLEPKLAKAAKLIMDGKSFVVRAAGRALVVRGTR